MAPHKYYTVGVSNQFAAFGLGNSSGEESEGEVILSGPPIQDSTESTGYSNTDGNIKSNIKKEGTPHKSHIVEPARSNRGQRAGPNHENRMNNPRGGRGGFHNTRKENGKEEDLDIQMARRRGGFRGRGGRGAQRGREYDRHSGMAKPRDNAKGGGGGHNWGKEDELQIASEGYSGKEEIRGESTPDAVGEDNVVEGEVEQGGEESNAKHDDGSIDYETYKLLVSERRANLPHFIPTSATQKQINTGKELEAQGYKVHQKEQLQKDTVEEEDSDQEEENRKKKAISVYEYIQQEGGRVNMFSSRRGGRGGARNGEDRRYSRRTSRGKPRSKDAPDIQDTRAFPSLGA